MPKLIARGPKALIAHAGYVVALMSAFLGFIWAQGVWRGQVEGHIDSLEHSIQGIRDERTALMGQRNRETEHLTAEMAATNARIDLLLIAERQGRK